MKNGGCQTNISTAMQTKTTLPANGRSFSSAVEGARLIRLPEVLSIYPLGKTSWYAGVKSGEFPKPVKLRGRRAVAWYEHQVIELAESLQKGT